MAYFWPRLAFVSRSVARATVNDRISDVRKERETRGRFVQEFLVIYRSQLTNEQQPIEAGSELEKWLDWAEQQADRVDPLVQSPPSIL